jgi:hypothetical protein
MEDVGIFNGHLVYFGIFCGHVLWLFGIYFFPFWYALPIKIWQPCGAAVHRNIVSKYLLVKAVPQIGFRVQNFKFGRRVGGILTRHRKCRKSWY